MTDTRPIQSRFQPSYRVSRERLIAGARALAPRHGVLIDSRSLTERGPDGETLALDFVMFGARRPRHAFVLSSGTHGVEGFTGSAFQHHLLEEVLPRLRLGPDTAIVIQHANNPYGFAWLRRVNENNVDFNRNFRDRFDTDQCSPDYEAMYDAINPSDLDPGNEQQRQQRMQAFIAEQGFRRFQAMLTEGQYKYPQGLQFGGQQLQPGVRHLLSLVKTHLVQADTVIWLDVHTGLGESGACELITGAPVDHPCYLFGNEVWGGKVKSATAGESLSVPLKGMMDMGLVPLFAPTTRFTCVAPEYGTHPPPVVLGALRADNWLQHHGQPGDAAAQRIKTDLMEAFKPASPEWEQQVMASGAELIDQALQHLPGVVR